MERLTRTIKRILTEQKELPFSVYTSVKEQHIINVPIIKPLLICILDGNKKLGLQSEVECPPGSFIFLSNKPNIDMRNIPSSKEYLALLIEFEDDDFNCLPHLTTKTNSHFQGKIESTLENTLLQFVEWSTFTPADLWHLRRQEILQVLLHLGYDQVSGLINSPSISQKIYKLISKDIASNTSVSELASILAMSESTLRRKLNEEGNSVQSIKENVRLRQGLHLIQTTKKTVAQVADQCGYSSQSRFTDKFKKLFGTTPTELRKTRLHD
jgi:AraC-like DNA-binding protein